MFVTSYLGRDGVAVGLGAAAHVDDHAATAAARSAVAAWSGVLRTRRLLLTAVGPLCPGARRAADIADDACADGPLYIYGELPGHSPSGTVRVSSVDEVPAGAGIMFPAHGVSPGVQTRATERGLRIIDATCPLVRKAQASVRAFADQGDMVLILGRRGHSAAEGVRSQAPGHVIYAETTDELPLGEDPGQVSIVLQPGVPVEELLPLAAAVRDRYPIRILHPDDWCYAASDRAAAIRAMAAETDMQFILGSPGSADAASLARIAPAGGVHIIDDVTQVRPDWIGSAATIGMAESNSVRPGAASAIITALSGLGPLSIVRRTVATTIDAPARSPGPDSHALLPVPVPTLAPA